MSPKRTTLDSLREMGFDRSYYNKGEGTYSVKCSGCEALVIMGTPCHETGCPNVPRKQEEDEEEL